MIKTRIAGLLLLVMVLIAAPTQAGTLDLNAIYNGGAPFMSANYMFLDVTETNGAPDEPAFNFYQDPFAFGDTLAFNPTNFRVEVTPGPGVGLVDSQLEMVIMGTNGAAVSTLTYSESGDYEVIGVNAGDAFVSAELNWFWQLLDGPNAGATGSGTSSFTSGAAPNDSGKWFLGFDETLPGGATKVRLEFDNRLTGSATTELSSAFISKKLIDGVTVGVPEPSGLALALIGLLAIRRRK